MTKQELIVLALEGNARIEVARVTTEYSISNPALDDDGVQLDSTAVFVRITVEQGTASTDGGYYDGILDSSDLSDAEAAALRRAIDAANARKT